MYSGNLSADLTPGLIGLNESDLCTKIQKLMDNLKQCKVGKVDNNGTTCTKSQKSNINLFPHTKDNATNYKMFSDSETYSSISQENNETSDLSITEGCQTSDMPPLHANTNNVNHGKRSEDLSFTLNNVIKSSQACNLLPERILPKLKVLENLIFATDESLSRSERHNSLRLRLLKLNKEFKEVKQEIECGTKQRLIDSEVLTLMITLKRLFENFYAIQKELDEEKVSCVNKNNREIMQGLKYTEYPMKPPRGKNKNTNTKERYCISNITSSSDDLLSLTQRDLQLRSASVSNLSLNNVNKHDFYLQRDNIFSKTNNSYRTCGENLSVLNTIRFKQKLLTDKIDTKMQLAVSETEIYKNYSENDVSSLCRFEMNNAFFQHTKPPKVIDFVDKEYNRFQNFLTKENKKLSESSGMAKSDIMHNKSSKVPVLKKENAVDDDMVGIGHISYLSQTIANKVYSNMLQTNIFENMTEKENHFRSKSENILKCTKNRNKMKKCSLPKVGDRLFRSCVTALYLTKLGSTRSRKYSKNNLHNNSLCKRSDSGVFCLETLLQKNKYRFVYEDSLSNLKNNLKKDESLNKTSVSHKSNHGAKRSLAITDDESDLRMLLSLAKNSIKIVNQIILYPSIVLETSSIDNLAKNPRLSNIENLCCCKIILLNRKEALKRNIKHDKRIKVMEIHYDLRKGKALGCINMLRQLAGQMAQSMKIFRSSVLLPGGFLKEMTSCSLPDLVNLSCQESQNNILFGSRNSLKRNSKLLKETKMGTKTFSLNCLQVS